MKKTLKSFKLKTKSIKYMYNSNYLTSVSKISLILMMK